MSKPFAGGPSLLFRYIIREIASPFFVTLFVFTGILFLIRSLDLIDLVVNKNVPLADILVLFSLIVPRFLEIAIPMSLLLGIIVAFGRLSSASELVVIRATGLSLQKLARPVFVCALGAFVCTLITGFWVRPWADYRFSQGVFELAKMQASAGLVPGVFNEVGNLTIYAETIEDRGARLRNVLIADRRTPDIKRNFVAPHGTIHSDDKTRTLTFTLYDGSIHEGSGLNYNVTYFDVNTINLSHSELIVGERLRGKQTEELYIHELIHLTGTLRASLQTAPQRADVLQQFRQHAVELHRRLAPPVSCLCIALIAMGLGIQPSRSGTSWGLMLNVVAGILMILCYYVLFAFAIAMGEHGSGPPGLFLWMPNGVFAILAYFFYRRMGSEEWFAISEAIQRMFNRLVVKLKLAPVKAP